MSRVSLKGICDMHVHTNPDLRLRAYSDLQLADAAVRVGARAIVIKSHLGFTVNRAAIVNDYVRKVYGENTGFTMYGGVVMNNLEAVESFGMEMQIFLFSMMFSLILVAIFRFGFKENRNIGKGVIFKKPEAFSNEQKTTLNLMILMMVVVLIFPLLKMIMPGNAAIKYIAGKVDVGLVAIIFAVIALLLKLAPQKEAIARIPWNTIIMIAGAGMLIAVAVEAGTIDMLSNWVGSNVPKPLIPIAFSIIAAIMSFFSSTTGVVAPALFPLIPALAASTGLSAPVLFACTVLGAQSSAISPFSSGGTLILGSTPKEEDGNKFFNRLLMVAVPISVLCCALYNFIVAMEDVGTII